MPAYQVPKLPKPAKVKKKQVLLVASGDLRLSANQVCWAAQKEMEEALGQAVANAGFELVRAHPYKEDEKHGLIASQKEGMCVFAGIDPAAKLIVAEAVWQYSHHVLAGLLSHKGPILTVANWSGQWPGLVGMLNLNASLTKAGKKYSTLWSEDFSEPTFLDKIAKWLETGSVRHPMKHVRPLGKVKVPAAERRLGEALAEQLKRHKAIMGVFDEGCMGMYNAIITDELLNPVGLFKERLSQSALYYETTQVPDEEARAVRQWMEDRGMTFVTGPYPEKDLTDDQILTQCKMYTAALR
ncbi:MAG: fucose isomerase, partial [Planctomycetota bacterium]